MADEAMLAMAGGDDDTDAIGLPAILAALPHLTGDELRQMAEAMPRVAGEWEDWPHQCRRRFGIEMGGAARGLERATVRPLTNGSGWVAVTTGPYEYSTHPTARAAQAACDARLRAAGVALCGEVVDG
jgi:hypothetical protein